MNTNSNIGVCFCEYLNGHPESFRLSELVSYVNNLNAVAALWNESNLPLSNVQSVVSTIRNENLKKILIVGNRPGHLKTFFSKAMKCAGRDPEQVILVSFPDHGIFQKNDQDKARALIAGIIYDYPYDRNINTETSTVHPDTVIIGGGITGIQAALEIANGGHKVVLVERTSSIGGHMAMFDKTFPTLDCAACILTPKMVEVGQHPNIELLTLSEVVDISGIPGNYMVKIRKKARYVTDKCTGCGECEKVCPIEISSEFESGLVNRKAIYRNFPQAIPNTYAISRTGMPFCKIACPIGQDVEGYMALTAKGKFKEAHELIRRTNALPSICGRVCYHSCEEVCKRACLDEPVSIRNVKRFITEKYSSKKIRLKKADPTNKKVAIVGSGPSGLACAHDLILRGHDVSIFEKQKRAGGMLITGIPEFRLPRKILNEDINFIKKLGVKILLNKFVGKNLTFDELRSGYDAVFLATGAHKSLEIGLDNENAEGVVHGVDFLRSVNLDDNDQIGKKVVVIGGGNTAIDSARVAVRLGAKLVSIVYRRSMDEMPATPGEVKAAREEGVLISLLAAPKEFIVKNNRIIAVRFAKMKLGEPDESGRRRPVEIKGKEFVQEADTVIIAASQKPEVDFLEKDKIKLSKWDTMVVNESNLSIDMPGFYAGGDAVSGPSSVVQAMAMGKKAALAIDSYLNKNTNQNYRDEELNMSEKEAIPELTASEIEDLKQKYKVEKRHRPTEISLQERRTSFNEVERTLSEEEAIAEAKRCLNCTICSICRECEKVCDPKAIDYNMKDEILEHNAGNIILATGFKPFDAGRIKEYGYGKYPNVFTSLEFERMVNASGPTGGKIMLRKRNDDGKLVLEENGAPPQSVAIIHCVGSRDQNYHAYCSKVCCMYSLKIGHLLKEKLPGSEIYEFYIDLRAFGKGYEEFQNRIVQEGVHLIRGLPARVEEKNKRLFIRSEDIINSRLSELEVDMVILSIGLEAQPDAEQISLKLGLMVDENGWFQEANYNIGPTETHRQAITIAGACQGPKDIPDSVAQGSAAAARVLQNILTKKIKFQDDVKNLREIEGVIHER